MTNNDDVQQIIDQIIKVADLGKMSEAEELSFRQNLGAQFHKRLGQVILSNLDDEGSKKYLQLIEDKIEPDSQEFKAVIEEHMPNYENVLKLEVGNFIEEAILALVK